MIDVNSEGVRRIVDGIGKRIDFNDDVDMDVESFSDLGWSVRDNFIVFDEFVMEESSEEEVEEWYMEIYEIFVLFRKVYNIIVVFFGKNVDFFLFSDLEYFKFFEFVE